MVQQIQNKTRLSIIIALITIVLLSCADEVSQNVTTPMERALYHFKMGETYNNAEESYKAMEEFLEAERLSRDVKNDMLNGQICWYKGKLYLDRLDYTNALNMFTLSAEYFTQAGQRGELMNSYEQMAIVHSKSNNLEDAIIYFDKCKMLALELKNSEIRQAPPSQVSHINEKYNKILLSFSTHLSGVYFNKLNSPRQALDQLQQAYKEYNNGKIHGQDYLLLSCIYLDEGNIQQARNYAQMYQGWKKNMQGVEKAALVLHTSRIEKESGNYQAALELRERYDQMIDSIKRIDNTNSIREVEQQFWQKQLKLENETIKLRHTYTITIYSLLLIILLIIGYMLYLLYRKRMHDKNKQLEEYLAMVSDLGDKIHIAERSKENLLGQLNIHIEKEKELKELLENRFMEVRELVRTYYEYGNSKKLQKKVEDLLKLQLSGDNFETIEQVVNAKNNNIIKKIRESHPTLKEENIKLLNLIYAGFSAQEISVILNDTPQNIYVRKSRLKKIITSVEETDLHIAQL